MKIQLFDADDLKAFEDTLAKALVRALRTVLKEGLIAGYKAPPAEQFADTLVRHISPGAPPYQPEEPPPAPPTVAAPPVQPQPVRAPEPPPFGRYIEREPEKPQPKPQKAPRENFSIWAKSVPTKPVGYVTLQEAYDLMDTNANSAQVQLRGWIKAKEVAAAIVCDRKLTPTKGLPGRVMVDAAQVRAREALRKKNSAMSPHDRAAAYKNVAQATA